MRDLAVAGPLASPGSAQAVAWWEFCRSLRPAAHQNGGSLRKESFAEGHAEAMLPKAPPPDTFPEEKNKGLGVFRKRKNGPESQRYLTTAQA